MFRSPLLDTTRNFDNAVYRQPVLPWTPYELVLDSGRFLEGAAGAPGFHWLMLFPVIVMAFVLRRRDPLQWACVALGVVFFLSVYVQQAYLRYLLPALFVGAAAAGWALADLPDGRAPRAIIGILGAVLIGLNLRFMYTGNWTQADLCPRCALDPKARTQYIVRYAPLTVVGEWLNVNLPEARVGFFTSNDPSPAGYTGYSRSIHWHDRAVHDAFARARDADDILAIVRAHGLTHAVVPDVAAPHQRAIAAFRDRDTQPVWRFGNYRVALITLATSPPSAEAAAR